MYVPKAIRLCTEIKIRRFTPERIRAQPSIYGGQIVQTRSEKQKSRDTSGFRPNVRKCVASLKHRETSNPKRIPVGLFHFASASARETTAARGLDDRKPFRFCRVAAALPFEKPRPARVRATTTRRQMIRSERGRFVTAAKFGAATGLRARQPSRYAVVCAS